MATNYEIWKTSIPCNFQNEKNPFDNAGKEHNELLAKIESLGNPEMTLDEVFNLSDSVLSDYFKENLPPNFSSKEIGTPIIEFASEEEYVSYINSLNIDERQRKAVFALNEILFRYNGDNICEIISEVVRFEEILMQKYNPSEMIVVLNASSIGRFSLAYWDSRVKGDTKNLAKKGFWKKFFTAVADVIGGVAGGIAGAPTVVGIGVGAVAGAVGTSAGFGEVWDIFAN